MKVKLIYQQQITIYGNSISDIQDKWNRVIDLDNLAMEEYNGNVSDIELLGVEKIEVVNDNYSRFIDFK